MARGKTLSSLLNDLRAETRRSQNVAHNTQAREAQVELLQRTQERLWHDFDWPHLRVRREIELQAGQRYYQPPEDLDIDRIEKLEVRYAETWLRLDPGIDSRHYAQWDSDLGFRSWPVRRWRIEEDEQIELWPIPDSDTDSVSLEGTLRATGIRKLRPLIDNNDVADLDNRLIVLYAAAEVLAADGAKDAQLKLTQANNLYSRIRGQLTPRRSFRMFGEDVQSRKPLRGPPTVYYRTDGN